MKVGIVVYPGSNCVEDTLYYFNNASYIWHKDDKLLKNIDLLVLPGDLLLEIDIIKTPLENMLYRLDKWHWNTCNTNNKKSL